MTAHSTSAHTYPAEPMLRLGFGEENRDKLDRLVARTKEEDRMVRLGDIRVQDDLTVNIGADNYKPQAGFLRLVSRMIGYPIKNLQSALPTDRVAGDINVLLGYEDSDERAMVRRQNGDLFGIWRTAGRAPHLPPKTAEVLAFANEQVDWLQASGLADSIQLSGELVSGRLSLSMMMAGKDVTGLTKDPSYAGLMTTFDLRDRPGMQTGFHLMRMMCTNSSFLHIGNGWSHATEDLDLTLDRFRRNMERSTSYLPLLQHVYARMVNTPIKDEMDFARLVKPVKQMIGPLTLDVLQKFTRLDEESGRRYFDAKEAKRNERTNVYALFNDLTYFAREGKLGTEIERRAQRAAGKVFEGIFEPVRKEYLEAA